MKRPVLLDSSFLIDLEREVASDAIGAARAFLPSLRGRPLVVSVITVAELLEGAVDETDAWLIATAEVLDADVVGADRTAFQRLGPKYLKYR